MSRSRPLLGLAATTLLAVPVAVAAPAAADKPTPTAPDYRIAVDPSATGAAIDDSMYGVFFEDINDAADGGLYAELVRNRSFEFLPVDRAGFSGLTGWSTASAVGGTGTVTPVNGAARMNERNRTYLQLGLTSPDGGWFGVTNNGSGNGIAVRAGAAYDFSVWVRTDAPAGTPISATLRSTTGTLLADPLNLRASGSGWTKVSGTLTARTTTDAGRLTVLAGGRGTVQLDMVSLFPRDTYKGRANGLRKDLAEKVAALDPGFVRFPGGCIVNVNSHYGYDASTNYERARSYQWKDTVGPVETRPTNANFWGYNQSYGLGYFEYFQFAEDIGAMPLPVVPALLTGCGQNRETVDEALLQRHIQDTLDLVEFANGDVTTKWGGLRADMGHPAPFGLTHIGVGNEENLPAAYARNFVRFRDAIQARYPEMTVISNSGPDDEGTTFDQHWAFNRANDVDMVDEHYYNSPTWFLQNNRRYDSYDRSGPKVFLGEYASLDNKHANSLAEAAYMTGLERNADVVKLASYAPLLANVDNAQWRPDMIWFDNDESWGSTSYEVQKLFMNNVGDRVVPTTATGKVVQPTPITGAIGLSTWSTAAKYDDVEVTAPDGTVLFSDDFADGNADGWRSLAGRGTWTAADQTYTQTSTTANDTLVAAADIAATDYDLTLKATKTAGSEGFLVAFGVKDSGNFYWWNLGGFNNTRTLVEKATGGAKETVFNRDGHRIETGRTYDVKVSVRGTKVTLFLDGVEFGSFSDDKVVEPFAQVVTQDEATGDLIVKVVNAQAAPAVTEVDLGGRRVAGKAQMTVLAGDPNEQNTRSAQPVRPVTSTVSGVASRFTRTFAPYSVTFLRIPTK